MTVSAATLFGSNSSGWQDDRIDPTEGFPCTFQELSFRALRLNKATAYLAKLILTSLSTS